MNGICIRAPCECEPSGGSCSCWHMLRRGLTRITCKVLDPSVHSTEVAALVSRCIPARYMASYCLLWNSIYKRKHHNLLGASKQTRGRNSAAAKNTEFEIQCCCVAAANEMPFSVLFLFTGPGVALSTRGPDRRRRANTTPGPPRAHTPSSLTGPVTARPREAWRQLAKPRRQCHPFLCCSLYPCPSTSSLSFWRSHYAFRSFHCCYLWPDLPSCFCLCLPSSRCLRCCCCYCWCCSGVLAHSVHPAAFFLRASNIVLSA